METIFRFPDPLVARHEPQWYPVAEKMSVGKSYNKPDPVDKGDCGPQCQYDCDNSSVTQEDTP